MKIEIFFWKTICI